MLTRREFFERASCTAAVLAIARTSVGQTSSGPSVGRASSGPPSTMFVSLNGAVTRGVSGTDKIRLAAKVGYGGVDWDLGPAKTAGLAATKALFAELEIRPTIVNLPMARPFPFGGETPAFNDALKMLVEGAAFVHDAGCAKMMVVLPASTSVPKADMRALAVDRLSAIAEILARSGIRLGIEFLGPLYFRTGRADGPKVEPFIWNMRDAVQLAKDAGGNVGVILDAWHWHHSQSSVADIADAGAARIVHVHVSDAKAMPPADVRDNMRLMPGEGVIDLLGFFTALKKAGYADGVSPEPLGRVPDTMSPEEAATLALDTTLGVMRKAGVA